MFDNTLGHILSNITPSNIYKATGKGGGKRKILRNFLSRKCWLLFMVLTITYAHYIIYNLTLTYLEAPTEVRMSTELVHISNIPFVGVALCSANKFSRRRMESLAKNLFEIQELHYPGLLAKDIDEMLQHLVVFAGFYVYPYDDYEAGDTRLIKLHQILTLMYNTSDYSTPELLRDLAPDCEKLVLRVRVFGKMVNVKDYIRTEVTSSSVCCMFNYQRYYMLESYSSIKFERDSWLNSVDFILQEDSADFFYMDMSNNAFQVTLFPPQNYARLESETTGEILISYNSFVMVSINPVYMMARQTIRQFSPKLRRCYYPEEGREMLKQKYYSVDECYLICRMNSMLNHCGCVNPSLPAKLINATFCNLLDFPCLTKWKKTWNGWNYFDYVDDQVQFRGKRGGSQRCNHCLPMCNTVHYIPSVNKSPMVKATFNHTYYYGILKNITDTQPLALIAFFFESTYVLPTESDNSSDWVILLNRFGGIMSLMYGFSLMSYIEIAFYLTGKWFTPLFKNTTRSETPKPIIKKELTSKENVVVDLYWQEILPNSFNIRLANKNQIRL